MSGDENSPRPQSCSEPIGKPLPLNGEASSVSRPMHGLCSLTVIEVKLLRKGPQ